MFAWDYHSGSWKVVCPGKRVSPSKLGRGSFPPGPPPFLLSPLGPHPHLHLLSGSGLSLKPGQGAEAPSATSSPGGEARSCWRP